MCTCMCMERLCRGIFLLPCGPAAQCIRPLQALCGIIALVVERRLWGFERRCILWALGLFLDQGLTAVCMVCCL